MNDYRITYATKDDQTFTETITERSETTAKKRFTTWNRGIGLIVTDIKLIRENTYATKQQERDALETIKKMVVELGLQSYLATAFAGCFADAEQNIENDAAYSIKGRLEYVEGKLTEAEQEIKRLQDKLAESEKDYETAHAAVHAIAEEKDAEIATLRRRAIPADDITDAIQLVTEKKFALDTEVKNAAERIVEAASEPESVAFKNAVTDHRAAKSELDYYTALLERLIKAKG